MHLNSSDIDKAYTYTFNIDVISSITYVVRSAHTHPLEIFHLTNRRSTLPLEKTTTLVGNY